MYVSIRRYKGDTKLADQLTPRRDEVETLIKTAPGFIAYSPGQGQRRRLSASPCANRRGAPRETNRLAADWIKKNMANANILTPEIYAGDVAINFSAKSGIKRLNERSRAMRGARGGERRAVSHEVIPSGTPPRFGAGARTLVSR